MKRVLVCIFLALLALSFAGCANSVSLTTPPATGEKDTGGETAVRDLVERFGARLQMVSLLAPKDVLGESMQENYGDLVSPSLLEKWLNDPANAPGRLVSSPWPDRIEIATVEELSKEEYRVKGDIIEVTSAEKESGEAAAKRSITIGVKKTDNRWLIDEVELGEYSEETSIAFVNEEFGFRFLLPNTWDGYSIVSEKWEGFAIDDKGNVSSEPAASGALILIRHPEWREEKPRQDIPIMVFTLDQWEALQDGKFHIGAAPINPTELGRNSKYVFALPARYNYSFPEGYEEVEEILEGKPLQVNM